MKRSGRPISATDRRARATLLSVLLSGFGALLIALLSLDTGCTLGSFAINNNNNNNANTNSNANANDNSNGNSNGNSNASISLGTAVNVSSSHNTNRSASIHEDNVRVDDLGALHVVFEEIDSSGQDLQVFYATMPSGGSWSAPVKLSAGTTGAAVQAGTARMDVHPTNGQVHVIWQQGIGTLGRAFASHNRSGTFVQSFAVSSASGEPAELPAVRVDGAGTAHYVWTRAITPRRIVYRALVAGSLSSGEEDVSARGTHGGDEALFEPAGLILLPPTNTDQAVGVLYSAVVSAQQFVLYTERSVGSSGSFGDIVDVSLDQSGTHLSGTTESEPRFALNTRGDLQLLWSSQASSGIRDTRGNGRPSGGSFRLASANITQASAGDSTRSTAPADVGAGRGLLDTTGGLHLVWEDIPGGSTATFRHRYFSPAGADPGSGAGTSFAETGSFSGAHALRAGLDSGENLYVAWEQEDSSGVRDLFVRRRGAGTSAGFETTTQLTSTTLDTQLRGLGVTSAGRVFVLGDEGSIPGVIAIVRETDGSISGSVDVSRQSGQVSNGVVLRMDPTGVAHAFWLTTFGSQRDLFHASIR